MVQYGDLYSYDPASQGLVSSYPRAGTPRRLGTEWTRTAMNSNGGGQRCGTRERPWERVSACDTNSNSNPFILHHVSENICVCQSYHGSLRREDGFVPSLPRELCVARLEKCLYWNSTTKSWCVPSGETNAHYCARVSCIRFVCPSFVVSSLVVSDNIRPHLNDVHKGQLLFEFLCQFKPILCDFNSFRVMSHFCTALLVVQCGWCS